jgi:hypothetical protein
MVTTAARVYLAITNVIIFSIIYVYTHAHMHDVSLKAEPTCENYKPSHSCITAY